MLSQRFPLSNVLQPTAALITGATQAAGSAASATSTAVKLAGRELQPLVDKILEIDLMELAVSGWKKYRALQKYRDPDQYPPDVVANLSLLEHTLKSTHHPRVDISINGKSLPSLEFDFELALDLEGVTLVVQGGRIREVAAGQCRAQAQLAYGGKPLWKQETDPFMFPGKVSLGDGVPIPAL